MESLSYEFAGTRRVQPFTPVLVGVVGSGNLEVLVEPSGEGDLSHFHVATSARGFGEIWQAVVQDFHERHRFKGLRFSINDMGATPAVVSLRLDQAAAGLKEESAP
ncbi:MAG: malonate decarboxylase acyl carrier protein [Bacteriovorax sp.]|nr:malonate decarboxylase acyl carrier protein [Rhizobacter sp.]